MSEGLLTVLVMRLLMASSKSDLVRLGVAKLTSARTEEKAAA